MLSMHCQGVPQGECEAVEKFGLSTPKTQRNAVVTYLRNCLGWHLEISAGESRVSFRFESFKFSPRPWAEVNYAFHTSCIRCATATSVTSIATDGG